ncbi:MAG: hypothetical protein KKG09_10620 [Verrucomicrobia bacterium]|nr:hypothetical protein [Verrucomicrobiota bacterium]MBU4292362.1 hypothetical protein [Verrucomicrobiota bacterium]MBU4428888.1 hypothetical protein [Verrucomicrobiota bacterium]MBU4498446.1 hypothetical protein [Verrucomicrobiota bacterium]
MNDVLKLNVVAEFNELVRRNRRSWNMGRIRSKDPRPEKAVRSALHRLGFRFVLHRKDLPGKPNIVGLTLFSFKVCYLFHHQV